MRKKLWLATSLLIVTAFVAGCQEQPELGAKPSLAIMVESSVAETGSAFMVSGSGFRPNQQVWVDFEWQTNDGSGAIQVYCEADQDGSINPVIGVPEDIIPGDYEIMISTGENVRDKQLVTTLPLHIQVGTR